MRLLNILAFLFAIAPNLCAQTPDRFERSVQLQMRDGSRRTVVVNAKRLFVNNDFTLLNGSPLNMKYVKTITMDSVTYFVKQISNLPETISILERVIEGKISFYISPRVSGNSSMYIEKDSVTYNLRMVKHYVNDRPVNIKEYVSYLKIFTEDCKTIDQSEVENNLPLHRKDLKSFISSYNQQCGWQTPERVKPKRKPALSLSVVGGVAVINSPLNYDIWTGKASLVGFFAGPSIEIKSQTLRAHRLRNDLLFEQLTGEGKTEPRPSGRYNIHAYNILQIKNILSANFNIYRTPTMNIELGIGAMFKLQLFNNTKITETRLTYSGPPTLRSPTDRFNIAPVVHGFVSFEKIGFRYQFNPLAIQMRAAETNGKEHRFSLHYKIKNRQD